jgi:hypothetical protein
MSENHAKPKSVSPAASPLAARYFLLRAQEKVPKEKGAPRLGRYAAPLRSSKRALREAEEGPVAQRWDPTLGGAQGLARFGAPISPAGGRIPSSRWGPCSAPRARPRNSTFARIARYGIRTVLACSPPFLRCSAAPKEYITADTSAFSGQLDLFLSLTTNH